MRQATSSACNVTAIFLATHFFADAYSSATLVRSKRKYGELSGSERERVYSKEDREVGLSYSALYPAHQTIHAKAIPGEVEEEGRRLRRISVYTSTIFQYIVAAFIEGEFLPPLLHAWMLRRPQRNGATAILLPI